MSNPIVDCPLCGNTTEAGPLMGKLKWTPLDENRYRAVGDRAVYTITNAYEAYWLEAVDRYGLTLFDLPVRGKPCATFRAAQVEAERVDKQRPRVGEMSGF